MPDEGRVPGGVDGFSVTPRPERTPWAGCGRSGDGVDGRAGPIPYLNSALSKLFRATFDNRSSSTMPFSA